jgi:hypothetical protein
MLPRPTLIERHGVSGTPLSQPSDLHTLSVDGVSEPHQGPTLQAKLGLRLALKMCALFSCLSKSITDVWIEYSEIGHMQASYEKKF